MKRIMGIDYGDARTGIAFSDLLCSIVGSTTVIHSRKPEKTLAEIVKLAKENEAGEIVMGLPKNMDGSEGPRAELCRSFAQQVEQATGMTIHADEYKRPDPCENPELERFYRWKGNIGLTVEDIALPVNRI